MSERFEYSLNGAYRCEDFAQHLAQNTFPRVPIGSDGWYIFFKTKVIKNKTYVYPVMNNHHKPQLHVYNYFNILGNDGKSLSKNGFHLLEIYGPTGPKMNILNVLNEKNGYLSNGALVVEYGLHVMSVLGDDGIWKFNLKEAFFNPDNTATIEYGYSEDGSPKVLYGHRQLLRFHSPLFQNQVIKFISNGTYEWLFEDCLQIAHGVRIRLDEDALRIARVACDNNLRNVVQYVDQQLVELYCCPENALDIPTFVFQNCIYFGLRHFLAHLVNHFECSKALKSKIQQLDIQKMSGEAMKTFAAKIFELST